MSNENELTQLKDTIAQLNKRVAILEDEQAIRKLQHTYGYYLDKCLYDEVVALYAEDCAASSRVGTAPEGFTLNVSANILPTTSMARCLVSCWTIRSYRISSMSMRMV